MEARRPNPLLFVFLLALAVRLFLLFVLQPITFRGDEDLTLRLARALAAHGGGSSFPPLWAHLVAVPIAIFHNAWLARVCVTVIGAANVALVYRIAERTMDGRAARAAGILYAFYPEQALFSHGLYAAIPLEFCALLGVALLFEGWPEKPTGRNSLLAFVSLGVGALLSPFGFLSWASLVFAFRSSRTVIASSAAVLVPIALFSLWSWSVSGDPAAFVRRQGNPATPSAPTAAAPVVSRTIRNFANLWTPNSYAAERFRVQYYRAGDSRGPGYLIAFAHVALVVLGIVGLVAAPKNHLKSYAVVSLALLSAASVTGLLVSRYRIFEMHVFILYAAYALTRGGYVRSVMSHRPRIAAVAALLLTFGAVCVARWSTIGSWP